MRAARYNEFGGPEVITVEEIADPAPGPGQVLIEVHAASINPWDVKLRSGVTGMQLQFPTTPGGDVEGTVKAVGDGVTSVQAGDRVWGSASSAAGNSGSMAELAITKADLIGPAPAGIDDVQAGALPLAGVSAWQALTQDLQLQSGQKLLVQGGGGAIGSIAVQIAKHLGAHVAATASAADLDYVKSLGADEVIDYKAEKFENQIHDYDAVFDTTGQNVFDRSLSVLRRGGRAVSMTAKADEAKTAELGLTATTLSTQVKAPALAELKRLVDEGVVKVRVAQTFPLDQVADAFRAFEQGARGKVVVVVKDKHED
jgi:NADPH:quinone reductase-like Zn-dependent oxidoreductase